MASSLLLSVSPTLANVSSDPAKLAKSRQLPKLTHNLRFYDGSCKNLSFLAHPPAAFRNGRRSLSGGFFLRNTRRRFVCKSQLAELAPATSAVYGLLLLGGGLFAFTRSGSKGSLFGGLTGAALSAAAYYLMQAPETKATGDALGFGSAFLFACVFGIRLAATKKLAPAGPLLGLSVFALVVYISAYLQDNI